MLWSKPVHDPPTPKSSHLGVDLTSSRVLAAAISHGRGRTLRLEDPSDELVLAVNLEHRTPVVGRAAHAIARKLPHLVCSNFLPALGQPREWKAGRHALSAAAALKLAFDRLRPAIEAESEAVALALPAYLTPPQVEAAIDTAHKANWPLEGTVAAPLALAADRAAGVLAGEREESEPDEPVVMPLHPAKPGPGFVAVIDADEHALNGVVIAVEPDRVHLVTAAAWPRAGLKLWTDRLVDAVSDRCVRVCRRDPRDSAEAEQALFEQLDAALDKSRAGHRVNLTLRTAQWFQDIVQQPEDFERACASLAQTAADGVQELLTAANLTGPPRAVWLTHAAGRLPGLAKAIHANSAESTAVDVLPPAAVALAAARLVPRWLNGELPRTHLDVEVPLKESGVRGQESEKTRPVNRVARPSS